MNDRLLLLSIVFCLGACTTRVGPFVKDIHRSGDTLVVHKCFIEKFGDELSNGSCTRKTIEVASSAANREPRYLYLPNPEVGEVSLRKKDYKSRQVRISTFSYTASPGLVFTMKVQLRGDRVLRNTIEVGITLDSHGVNQLTGATELVMVVNGEPLQKLYLNWKSRQRGPLTHETLRRQLQASWVVSQVQEVKTLELQFGGRNYALPSNAAASLNSFLGYIEARMPAAPPPAVEGEPAALGAGET